MPYRPPPIGPKSLTVTGPAQADIDGILDYLAHEAGLETALRIADTFDTELSKLAFLGHAGVSREWVSPGLRMTVIGSYVVFFRVSDAETIILRILHGSRDLSAIDFSSDPTARI